MTDDLDRLMAVMDAAFDPLYQEAWKRRQVEEALLTGYCRYFLASNLSNSIKPDANNNNNETACAFYLSRQIVNETELLLFAVSPDFRGKGLGLQMLEHLAETAKANGSDRIFLEMRRGNPAENLYRRFGFTPVGLRPNYYRYLDGTRVDAITLAMAI